jgi:alcohol dehydrogenase
MDTAKGAAITVGKPSPINQYMADIYTGPPLDRTVKLVQVPTTSGTCAEASRTILVMDTQRDIKAQIISQRNKADYVLYDPLLTLGVPPYLTAVTGMDALSHAVDALGSNNRNHWSYKNCGYAIDLIWHGLPKAMEKPGDIEARSDLLFASYLALTGECLGNSGHPMAHAIGGLYHNIPHGHICGWTSPIAMYNGRENCAESIRLIASKIDLDLKSETLAKDVRNAMIQFARSIGLKPPAEMGCDRESIVRLAPIGLRDPILTTADPPVDLEQMKILLGQVYDQELI